MVRQSLYRVIDESFYVYLFRIIVSIDERKHYNMTHKQFTSAHIDRYLQGKMSPQEEREFLLSIKRDKRLRHVALIKALFIKQIKACRSKVTNTDHDKRSNTNT